MMNARHWMPLLLMMLTLGACDDVQNLPVDAGQISVDGRWVSPEQGTLDWRGDGPGDGSVEGPADLTVPPVDQAPDTAAAPDLLIEPPTDLGGDTTTPVDTLLDVAADVAAVDLMADVAVDLPAPDVGGNDGSSVDLFDAAMDALLCNGANCDDNLLCTQDYCTDNGCLNVVKPGLCLIGGLCRQDGDKKSVGSCLSCNSLISATSWTANSSQCPDDGLACTVASCTAGGTCVKTLKPGYCLIGGVCVAAGTIPSSNSCQVCKPLASTSGWSSRADGSSCISDGLGCTADLCAKGTCTHALASGTCLVNGQCYKSGQIIGSAGCTGCNAALSQTVPQPLKSGTACASDGLTCTKDACNGSGKCLHSPNSGTCAFGGKCYTNGQASTSGGCVGCNTAKSQTASNALNNGTACASDSLSCTKDACNGSGACLHKPNNGTCAFGGKCYTNGQASKSGGCVGCNAAKSQTASNALNNGTACASDSLSCTKDACNGSGSCLHSVYSGYCVISNKCWAKGQGSCK